MANDNTTVSSLDARDFLAAFDLDRADIKDICIYHENGSLIIAVELNIKNHKCPVCGSDTSKVKGYTLKKIKHSVLNPVPCIIHYRARRYICPTCGKTFYEENPFVLTGFKVSVATVYNVLSELKRPECTFTSVADKYNLSPSSVSNIFDNCIDIGRRPLPECISFDEVYAFKSKDSDYVCVLLDYTNKKIIDILPSRKQRYLSDYLAAIPKKERKKVLYASFDMWQTYRRISKQFFPNCICIVDKFHVLQELSRRFNTVRIQVMNDNWKIKEELKKKQKELKIQNKKLDPKDYEDFNRADINYYLLKKFNFLLTSNDYKLLDPNKEKRFNKRLSQYTNYYDLYTMMLKIDPRLKEAAELKEEIYYFYRCASYETAKAALETLMMIYRTSNLKPFQTFVNTLTEWKSEIINSFIVIPSINKKMNNGLIENRNKSIKLLKHSSNGYTNWDRFRNRVLYVLNDDVPINISGKKVKKK